MPTGVKGSLDAQVVRRFLMARLTTGPTPLNYKRRNRTITSHHTVTYLNGSRISRADYCYIHNLTTQRTADLGRVDTIFVKHHLDWWEFEEWSQERNPQGTSMSQIEDWR